MSKVKYVLVEQQQDIEQQQYIESVDRRWYLRLGAACGLVLLIIYYNWAATSNGGYYTNLDNHVVVATKTSVSTTIAKIDYISISTSATTRLSAESSSTRASQILKTLHIVSPTNSSKEYAITIGATETTRQTATATTERVFKLQFQNASMDGDMQAAGRFFVHTSECHMPWLDPFAKDAMKIYTKKSYTKCDGSKDIVTVRYNQETKRYHLQIGRSDVICCYKSILRAGTRGQADNDYKLLPCSSFHNDNELPKHVDAIITECRLLNSTKILQVDAFSFVQPREEQQQANASQILSKPSILLWGIDSLSRINFERTMPLMHKYLQEQHWFELQGYNKMGDNTYPNLMAVLTGYNSTRAYAVCRPKSTGGLDTCPLMWSDYKKQGYITAFAEDWVKFSTFNYLKKGFLKPPTDYYLRPMVLAIENKLKKKFVSGIPSCVGRRNYAEYIYDYGVQFTQTFKDQPTFGMFWANTFSHNAFNMPSSMDARMVEYMRTLDRNGIMNNTIIIFFSDHGMRFGPLRNLDSGFIEERLPMFYMRLPGWFRQQYPHYVEALKLNKNRLTSPYDIYATLQHLLHLGEPTKLLPPPEGCPKCQSIFLEMAESRNCRNAGIEEHWCTCGAYQSVKTTEPIIAELTQRVIDTMNAYLADMHLSSICANLTLSKIVSAESKELLKAEAVVEEDFFHIRYETEPNKALFEATVALYTETQRITVNMAEISRLNAYETDAQCVNIKQAKKFCICKPTAQNNA